jgi:hypothetical protein
MIPKNLRYKTMETVDFPEQPCIRPRKISREPTTIVQNFPSHTLEAGKFTERTG